ncbi:transcription factor bHLH95 [Abrus precatorius]|uniref:Transcription factor bHLH95 n=1 Tax=Abrus precatorius TaxID=3816 RepID=A0A8B8KWS0_ABRPR|nr:transcription factor bHLH95 [Abrus precatorius]
MNLTTGDQDSHDLTFLWENQSWEPSNSDESGESKENMTPLNESKERNEGDQAVVKKKRSRRITSENENIASGEGKHGKGRESDHEMHIWTERERRKKMRNMFASLHALLPQLPSKADKSTIVDEAVNYIRSLQKNLQQLEKQKQERLQRVSTFACESSIVNSQWQPYDLRDAIITDQGSYNNFSNAITMGTSSSAPSTSQQQIAPFDRWTTANVALNICGGDAQFSIYAPKKPNLLTTIAYVLDKYNIEVMSANILSNRSENSCMVLAQAKRAPSQFPDAISAKEAFKQAAGEITLFIS